MHNVKSIGLSLFCFSVGFVLGFVIVFIILFPPIRFSYIFSLVLFMQFYYIAYNPTMQNISVTMQNTDTILFSFHPDNSK